MPYLLECGTAVIQNSYGKSIAQPPPELKNQLYIFLNRKGRHNACRGTATTRQFHRHYDQSETGRWEEVDVVVDVLDPIYASSEQNPVSNEVRTVPRIE